MHIRALKSINQSISLSLSLSFSLSLTHIHTFPILPHTLILPETIRLSWGIANWLMEQFCLYRLNIWVCNLLSPLSCSLSLPSFFLSPNQHILPWPTQLCRWKCLMTDAVSQIHRCIMFAACSLKMRPEMHVGFAEHHDWCNRSSAAWVRNLCVGYNAVIPRNPTRFWSHSLKCQDKWGALWEGALQTPESALDRPF